MQDMTFPSPKDDPARGSNDDLTECFRRTVSAKRQVYTELLKSLCEVECGSEMLEGVRRVTDIVTERLSLLGLSIERHSADGFADHITASTAVPGYRIVLGGHLDTTYTDYGQLPVPHVEGDWMIGPGTADMKGGVVVFLAALDCLHEAGLLNKLPVTVFLNSDEERGAATSRPILEELATKSVAALFSECAGPQGELVVSRRAKLSYRVDVRGVGRHAGEKSVSKASAIVELAHKTIALEDLASQFPGASFNVGRFSGGFAGNTVPQEATALLDIRYSSVEMDRAIKDAVLAIGGRQYVEGSRCELTLTSYRPAWPPTPATLELYSQASAVASMLGQRVGREDRGGTADSNWFGALGVPCLDGFGPIGLSDHTPQERAHLPSLFERILLAAALLVDLGRKQKA